MMKVVRKRPARRCPCEVVGRGPNWLFIRVEPGSTRRLSDRVWDMAQRHFVTRVLLEIEAPWEASQELADEMRRLCQRLTRQGGVLRLSGLPDDVAEALLEAAHCGRLAHDATPHDAVVGPQPCCEDSHEEPDTVEHEKPVAVKRMRRPAKRGVPFAAR